MMWNLQQSLEAQRTAAEASLRLRSMVSGKLPIVTIQIWLCICYAYTAEQVCVFAERGLSRKECYKLVFVLLISELVNNSAYDSWWLTSSRLVVNYRLP